MQILFHFLSERLHYFYIRQTALEVGTEQGQIKTYKNTYRKTPKNSDTRKFAIITL